MNSDPVSGGSHISTTPTPPISTLLSSIKLRTKPNSKPQNSRSTLNTARTTIRPKISKKKSIPPPKIPDPPENTIPVIPPTLPFQIINNSTKPQNYDSAPGPILPGGFCNKSRLFFVKSKGKALNFEPPDVVISPEVNSEVNEGVKEVAKEVLKEGVKEVLKEGVKEECVLGKKLRRSINLIGSEGNNSSELNVKKAKPGGSEGNFVKLNINGYGRKKFAFKSKGRNFSSNSSKRQRSWNKSKKSGSVKVGGGSEEFDEEGLVLDVKCGEERLDFDNESIEEAVMRVRNEASDENLVKLLKLTHGYDSFRNGQLEAVKMVLDGKSTMLVLPTGAGKSLCYQLPALVFPGITLVVSPLVALMIDQLKQLPPAIRGGLLSSSQSMEEASETLRLLQEGVIKVLFVSPERFLNAEFISIFSGSSRLSLVVVDEAHCVSEWSHNFRPSYMRLRASLLCGKLNAGCILAMTATATTKTLSDVMHALDIPRTNLVQSAKLRDNLHLSVSMSGNRMKDLIALLKSSPFSGIKSMIIYCKFQSETDSISKFLCDNNISSKSYHGGIPARDRIRVQEMFCSNKIRVVVATVAFGMGLDKRDVGAVLHYSLPGSLEEYVQEVGRAGRDGRLAYCHLLFDNATYLKFRSLMHSDGVDEYNVNKLLTQIFTNDKVSPKEVCSLVKESASRKFDMKEEVILTILTQLELGEVKYIHLLPQINVTCVLNFYQTSPAQLAAKDIAIASIMKKSEIKDGQYVFHIPSVANSIGIQALDLLNHLQTLKFKGEISYELKDQAFCYTIIDVPKDICSLAAQLTKWLGEIEACKVRKIDTMYNAASFAVKGCEKALGCQKDEHTPCLQKKILEYFNSDGEADEPIQMEESSSFLRADIKVFLRSNAQAKFTPRAIARILHGLASPAFPSATWSRTHFWGRYVNKDFKTIMEAAKSELISFVGKDVSYLE